MKRKYLILALAVTGLMLVGARAAVAEGTVGAPLVSEGISLELGHRDYLNYCAACHGADGKGMQAIGAPNLTDKVWLHGWGEAAIVDIVNNGKTNIMPQHASRLSPDQIRVLASYVWSLSHKGDKQTALAPAGDAKAQ